MTTNGFWVQAMYLVPQKVPTVALHYQDWTIQVSPAEARAIAANLLRAAESAQQDGFIAEWFVQKFNAPPRGAARLLEEYREHRKKWEETVSVSCDDPKEAT